MDDCLTHLLTFVQASARAAVDARAAHRTVLPASYRADREEEMVDTYLECTTGGAGADDLRPTLSEVASVAALAGATGAVTRRVGGRVGGALCAARGNASSAKTV